MDQSTNTDTRMLDIAIDECSLYIAENRKSSRLLLLGFVQLMFFVVMGATFLFFYLSKFELPSGLTFSTSVVTGVIVLISILLGLLVSLYRFHLLEIARTEHYKIGFLRIRVAANNEAKGFGSEVRRALTEGAFTYEVAKSRMVGRVESPLPGHPTSDISSTLINKVLDSVDFVLKPKLVREPKV